MPITRGVIYFTRVLWKATTAGGENIWVATSCGLHPRNPATSTSALPHPMSTAFCEHCFCWIGLLRDARALVRAQPRENVVRSMLHAAGDSTVHKLDLVIYLDEHWMNTVCRNLHPKHCANAKIDLLLIVNQCV